jgi:hypothetical protein
MGVFSQKCSKKHMDSVFSSAPAKSKPTALHANLLKACIGCGIGFSLSKSPLKQALVQLFRHRAASGKVWWYQITCGNVRHIKLERMEEAQFIEQISCQFPYGDPEAARRLAAQACSISPNAAFAVADEVSRPPRGAIVPPELQIEVFSILEKEIEHPLAGPVVSAARRIAGGEELSESEAVFLMRQIEQFPGQYAALSIAYLGCADTSGRADQEQERIRESWDAH